MKLYKVSEVAKMLLVTPMHVYRLIYAGKLKALKGKWMVRVTEYDILEFYNNHGTRPLRKHKKIMQDIS